jgi:hypothetical protein
VSGFGDNLVPKKSSKQQDVLTPHLLMEAMSILRVARSFKMLPRVTTLSVLHGMIAIPITVTLELALFALKTQPMSVQAGSPATHMDNVHLRKLRPLAKATKTVKQASVSRTQMLATTTVLLATILQP